MQRKLREEFKHNYNKDVQICLLNYFISNPDTFSQAQSILKEEYFDDQLAPTARFILQYAEDHRSIPDASIIHAKTGVRLQPLEREAVIKQQNWFLTEIEAFCKYRAIENAILDGPDLLRNGEAGEVERRIKEAMTISLVSDLGTNYFADPETRLRRMLDKSSFISTGWEALDEKLYGGFSIGGLNVFCGGSGSGKSLVLQNLALNWAMKGFRVIYFTLELSEDLVSLRLDSMVSARGTKEVFRNISDVSLQIGVLKARDRLFVKKIPQGATSNDLRAFTKQYEITTGHRPDAILVDYLDLMHPNNSKIDVSNLFVKDKYVSEELRGLMDETKTFGATASQLNRGATEANGEFTHAHIAGGISKINTADVVVFLTPPQRSEYTMMLMKTRSSSSMNHRIKLGYNEQSMRIGEPTGDPDRTVSYAELREEIKGAPEPPAGAEDQEYGDKLRGLFARR